MSVFETLVSGTAKAVSYGTEHNILVSKPPLVHHSGCFRASVHWRRRDPFWASVYRGFTQLQGRFCPDRAWNGIAPVRQDSL